MKDNNNLLWIIGIILAIFIVANLGKGTLFSVFELPTGAISHWSFQELAKDTILNNDGNIYGATTVTGVKGNGIRFGDPEDYIEIPHSQSLNIQSPFSISLWLNLESLPTESAIISKIDNNQGYKLSISNGRLSACTKTIGIDSCLTFPRYYDFIGKWIYIVFTNDGNENKLYINGYLMNEDRGAFTASSSNILIGDGPIIGSIDEVALYDKALQSSEINDYYDAAVIGSEEVVRVVPTETSEITCFAIEDNQCVKKKRAAATCEIGEFVDGIDCIFALTNLQAEPSKEPEPPEKNLAFLFIITIGGLVYITTRR